MIHTQGRARTWLVAAAVTDRPVPLPDGSTVGVYEYGDPGGRPVFAFHGVPACGAGFDWADEPARSRGIRLLAPDRPGVGKLSLIHI